MLTPSAGLSWGNHASHSCIGYFGHPFENLSTLPFTTLFFFVSGYSILKLQGNVSKALVLPF
jgi:hypothetical protein